MPSILSSCGRKVVRKCQVPASWPNPEPGTTQMPVASSKSKQYCVSAGTPIFLQWSNHFVGNLSCGKAYMAPLEGLQLTPSRLFKPLTNLSARRCRDSKILLYSALYDS